MRLRSNLSKTAIDDYLSIRETMKSKKNSLSTKIADLSTLRKNLANNAKKAWRIVQSLQDDINKLNNEVNKYEKLIIIKENEYKTLEEEKTTYRINYILQYGSLDFLVKDDKYTRYTNDQKVLLTHIEFYREKISDLNLRVRKITKDIETPRSEMRSLNMRLSEIGQRIQELEDERKSLEKDISKTNINIQIVSIELKKTQTDNYDIIQMEYVTVRHNTFLVKTKENIYSLLDYVRVTKTVEGKQAPVWYKVKEGRDLTMVKDDRNKDLEKVYQDYKAKLS